MNWSALSLPLLRRERSSKWLFGVCSGLARTTGISVSLIRLSVIGLVLVFSWKVPVAYVVSVLLTRYREGEPLTNARGDTLQAEGQGLGDARERFAVLSSRLAELEAEIVSDAEMHRLSDKTRPPAQRPVS